MSQYIEMSGNPVENPIFPLIKTLPKPGENQDYRRIPVTGGTGRQESSTVRDVLIRVNPEIAEDESGADEII